MSTGLVVASTQGDNAIQTTTPHGLSVGSAVSYMNEIRFVTAVQNASSISMNAPFSNALAANAALMPTLTFSLATGLPSVTLYDYWDPISAVSRIVTGAAVDTFSFSANGDFHEFVFNGPACDLLNSTSFVAGSAGLNTFPAEPALQEFDYSVVPGHLGQAWIGSAPDQFFTVTQATIELKNNIDLRNQEYGSSYPRDIAAGQRQVSSTFSLFTQDDNQTTALYDAAQQRDQISAMLQLGLRNGELMGIFLPSVTPEIPNYVDSEVRLQWDFKNNLAQGTAENELYIAFA
ncbi:MAG TPA: phage tail tube protein [Terriglobia bacterium]|nr:phage tail tube protein [Terriglobia bacterium]